MSISNFLEMLDRMHKGPVCTRKEWETKVIPTKVSQKLKEHGLHGTFSRENPINTDDALADEFFKAGSELAVEMGVFCRDTERVVKVSEEELKDAMRYAPSEVPLGTGIDRRVLKHRRPEDRNPPLICASLGIVVSEDLYVPLMQGIVQNPEIDIFEGGSLQTIFGHPVLAGTPYETLLGRYHAQLTREALWRAGRPGMPIVAIISATTEYGQLGGFGIKGGFDPDTNLVLILAPGDFQTAYMILHKIAHALNCGAKIQSGMSSFIGGYTGPPEGAVLAQIATTFYQFSILQAHICVESIFDIRYGGNCGREGQWATSVAYQAISRNTHVVRGTTMNQVAGPCTEMLLYESAVAMLNVSSSGLSRVDIPRSAGGKYADYLTPLECKFCAEVLKRSAGMSRKQVNEIVKVLIPKYEDKLLRPPKGKSFRECYDLKTLKPTQEWLDIYLKVKGELIELGVPLE